MGVLFRSDESGRPPDRRRVPVGVWGPVLVELSCEPCQQESGDPNGVAMPENLRSPLDSFDLRVFFYDYGAVWAGIFSTKPCKVRS